MANGDGKWGEDEYLLKLLFNKEGEYTSVSAEFADDIDNKVVLELIAKDVLITALKMPMQILKQRGVDRALIKQFYQGVFGMIEDYKKFNDSLIEKLFDEDEEVDLLHNVWWK